MVKFKYDISGETFKRVLPTRWCEITIGQLEQYEPVLVNKPTTNELISLLSDTPKFHVDLFPKELIEVLTDVIQFVYSDLIIVNDAKQLHFEPIGKLQVNQFEHWRTRMTLSETVALLHSGTEDNPYQFSKRMDMLDDIKELPCDIAIWCKDFYNKSFAEHVKKFASLYEPYERTDEEINAGYEDLARWGIYSTYEELAQGDIFRVEQVAKLSVDEVYYFLLYRRTKQEYQKNLNDAIQRNTKHA